MSTYRPTAQQVKDLRSRTGAGPMDCKKALVAANGDSEQALAAIELAVGKKADKLAGRATSEGRVGQYIHATGKVGVLVQIECNTDFVAGNDIFKDFVNDVALHIAGSPDVLFVAESEIPQDLIDSEREFLAAQVSAGVAPEIQEKILTGKIAKWKKEVVLLNQVHVNTVKHDNKTIEQLRAETSTRTGENIEIKRFARFQI